MGIKVLMFEDLTKMLLIVLKLLIKFVTSVMVGDFKTAQGSGRLYIVFTKVNSEMYQEILEHFMILSSEEFM